MFTSWTSYQSSSCHVSTSGTVTVTKLSFERVGGEYGMLNYVVPTLISRIIKKLLVSPEVSEAFYVTDHEHWLDLFIFQS